MIPLQAIAVCHDANTVHGDIKPANFLLKNALKKGSSTAVEEAAGNGAWVKAIDFGCSQVVNPEKPLTRRYCHTVYLSRQHKLLGSAFCRALREPVQCFNLYVHFYKE